MIVIMQTGAKPDQIANVVDRIESLGFDVHKSTGDERTILGVVGELSPDEIDKEHLQMMAGVDRVVRVSSRFKLAGRDMHPQDTLVKLNGVAVGGQKVAVIAGPCAVESREQVLEAAHAVKEAGAVALRGGAYKPRTSPFSFQGLGEEGLKYLAEAREATGLPIVTEVMDPGLVDLVASYADVLQVGARSMQNYALLQAVGDSQKPVLLKRGMSNTIEEWLMAADYVLSRDNPNVMLCERGLRSFETQTRFTLDINAIPVVKKLSHLPIIADPSHGTGHIDYVGPVARAAIAAGADGLIIEVHPEPEKAFSDGQQSLRPESFAALMKQIASIAEAIGRTL